MIGNSYQICTNCIMDTSDAIIVFDERGRCDYCCNFEHNIQPNWHTDVAGEKELLLLAEKIKQQGEGKDFDCIIGLSGGLDSSYTAYIAKEMMGLRPLLFHVDAGWNTDKAVGNIEKLVDGLGLDLYTDVINWEEMKDLQLAFHCIFEFGEIAAGNRGRIGFSLQHPGPDVLFATGKNITNLTW